MALWQCAFFVVPRDSGDCLKKSEFDDEWGFDDSWCWKNTYVKHEFFDPVAEFLPKTRPWRKELYIFGGVDSNVFEVSTESGFVISVSFRIDFSSEYEYVLSSIIEFCLLHGLWIISQELEILPLNFTAVKKHITDSAQFKKYHAFLKLE